MLFFKPHIWSLVIGVDVVGAKDTLKVFNLPILAHIFLLGGLSWLGFVANTDKLQENRTTELVYGFFKIYRKWTGGLIWGLKTASISRAENLPFSHDMSTGRKGGTWKFDDSLITLWPSRDNEPVSDKNTSPAVIRVLNCKKSIKVK